MSEEFKRHMQRRYRDAGIDPADPYAGPLYFARTVAVSLAEFAKAADGRNRDEFGRAPREDR